MADTACILNLSCRALSSTDGISHTVTVPLIPSLNFLLPVIKPATYQCERGLM
jgi:hypothetical protein